MAETYKILGQSDPAATTPTSVYEVPAATTAIINEITICNRDSSDHTIRIALCDDEGSIGDEEYIVYDATIPANDSIGIERSYTLQAGKIVAAYVDAQELSITVCGVEITAD